MPIYKMKGKKDGLQKYRVRINFLDALGKPKQIDRVAYGVDNAKLLELQLTHSVKQDAPAKKITVGELYEEYVSVKKHEVRETTLNASEKVIRLHILPTLGQVRLDKLSIAVLQQWKIDTQQKNLSITTLKNAFATLRGLINYAVKMEYITKNPLTKLGNFKDATASKAKIRFYTAEEFVRFIGTAKACAVAAEEAGSTLEWHYYVFFSIAFYTGLRKGEIHALQWGDIEGGYLSVNRSVAQKLKGEDRITPPKNKSSIRTLQLPKPLLTILEEHRTRCKDLIKQCDSCYICGGTRSLRDTTIQNRNEKYATLAGVKTIRIHDFRHSHVSLLANAGINIQEIARRLGHAKIEMTWNTYAHLYPREEERAVAILDEIV